MSPKGSKSSLDATSASPPPVTNLNQWGVWPFLNGGFPVFLFPVELSALRPSSCGLGVERMKILRPPRPPTNPFDDQPRPLPPPRILVQTLPPSSVVSLILLPNNHYYDPYIRPYCLGGRGGATTPPHHHPHHHHQRNTEGEESALGTTTTAS